MMDKMTKDFNFAPHTIILLVGPTNAGKTYFTENVLIPKLRKPHPTKPTIVQHISSDNIRRDLLGGQNFDKYHSAMSYASEQAFGLLYEKVRAVTSYPINAEFVIVDTKGIDKNFREKIYAIAQQNNYKVDVVMFHYKEMQDYFSETMSMDVKKSVSKDMKKINTEVYKTFDKKKVNNIFRIRSKDFSDINVTVNDWDFYVSHFLDNNFEYVVVGDVHGCLDDLKQLLEKSGFIIVDNKIVGNREIPKKIVLVGDFVDKGKQIKETIDFVHNNLEHFHVVIGNHENRIYKELKGTLRKLDNEFFDTYEMLVDDKETTDKFFAIVERSKHFFIGQHFIVTHAPCNKKYLGKIDASSFRKQRSIIYPKSEGVSPEEYQDNLNDFLAFVKEEAVTNNPYHVFGHIPFKDVAKIKNKIALDTGCVAGNKLSSITITIDGNNFIKSVHATNKEEHRLPALFRGSKEEKEVDITQLEPDDIKRIKYLARHKVNFISGTVCPADKVMETNELESIETALQYYKNVGVKKIVLQPKYMGSRCNMYLHKDIEQSYAVSRNGYKIKKLELMPVYQKMAEKLKPYFDKGAEVIILDGELMPWKALGKGLIENEFEVVGKAIGDEIAWLKSVGFEDKLNELGSEYDQTEFENEVHKGSKKDLIDKYGNNKYETYNLFHNFRKGYETVEVQENAHNVYMKQMELYGQESEVDYKGFSILKVVYEDGKEELFYDKSNYDMFNMLNDDKCLLIDMEDESYIEQAKNFYNATTIENKMEGIVMKPDIVFNPRIAPFIKVRNPEYLSIIYGYDYRFPKKYQSLLKQKDIRRKLRTSIKEFAIGKAMLEIPYKEISMDNQKYINIATSMVLEEYHEAELDPRL